MKMWGKRAMNAPVCPLIRVFVGTAALVALGNAVQAGPIVVPNGSFEDPPVPQVSPFAIPETGAWQHITMPTYWLGIGNTQTDWDQTVGVFYNAGNLVDNLDGVQGGFFFAAPENELYQDLTATFQVGSYYHVSFMAEGGGYGMPLGTPLQVRLFYRDAGNISVTIPSGSLTVTNTNDNPLADPLTHLTAYSFDTPIVQAGDAWAGKSIGIAITSLSDFGNGSGFWDLDNVQLAQVPEPASLGILVLGALGMCLRRRRE